VTARTLVVVGVLCVLASAAGCGGGGVSSADRLKADHRIALTRQISGITDVERVGDWSGRGDIVVAWVKVTPTKGAPYVRCVSVDISQRIDNQADLTLAVTTVPKSECKGTEPKP
jgi:hypothetical protein